MRRRHELIEIEWERQQRLLAPRKAGKLQQDNGRIINDILWKLATVTPWRGRPERYGS